MHLVTGAPLTKLLELQTLLKLFLIFLTAIANSLAGRALELNGVILWHIFNVE